MTALQKLLPDLTNFPRFREIRWICTHVTLLLLRIVWKYVNKRWLFYLDVQKKWYSVNLVLGLWLILSYPWLKIKSTKVYSNINNFSKFQRNLADFWEQSRADLVFTNRFPVRASFNFVTTCIIISIVSFIIILSAILYMCVSHIVATTQLHESETVSFDSAPVFIIFRTHLFLFP